jgi:hypothetical protein
MTSICREPWAGLPAFGHANRGFIVLEKRRLGCLLKTQFVENGAKVLGGFGGSDELGLCLGRASGHGRLDFGMIDASTATEHHKTESTSGKPGKS